MEKKANILLIYTGGTIGMIKDFKTGALRAFDFDDLLKHIPELKILDCEIATTSFKTPIDSSSINPQDWQNLASIIEENYHAYDGFVVLHGSDTMSFTSSAMSFMLENLSKPIIFTGSQLPIGDLRTDAKENLITSIQLASLREKGKPKIREVCLYFEYKLYRANRTSKIHAEHFEAFSSYNYPPLATSGVHLVVNHDALLPRPKVERPLHVHKDLCSNVLILKMFPGISKDIIQHIFSYPKLEGLVLETYGSGNLTDEGWFLDALRELIDSGVHVVNVTQCSGGSVIMGLYETSVEMMRMGVISGKDITSEAAIVKMMCLLGQNISPKSFKTFFGTALRGEMR
ncbi:MAG TPA: asparaginase [Flavobacteriaceae bacterium]|nr:asparaginase [Flavobacteriaceae bacterium]